MKIIVNVILGAFMVTSCTSDFVQVAVNDSEKLIPSGKVWVSDAIVKLFKYGVTDPEEFIKQGNLLVVGRSFEDFQVRAIDIRTEECRGLLRFGEGEHHAVGITSLSIGPHGSVTALDFQSGRLHDLPVSPLARGASSSELQMGKERQHLSAVKGETFVISTGIYEEGRYRYYSLESEEKHYYLSYPGHPDYPDMSVKAKSILYASTVLRLRPDNKAFVCTDIRSGIMDICRVEGDKIEGVSRHAYYYPKVEVIEDKQISVAYYKDNKSGFRDIAVSNDRIYVLYSGKTYREARQNISQCQTLLVFDWEGNLLSSAEIDVPVYRISFDMEENVLYGLKGTYGDIVLVRLNV